MRPCRLVWPLSWTPSHVGLNGALDELLELARGIHPPILTKGGLGPALKALAAPLRRAGRSCPAHGGPAA